jgi:osmotically-inducible protein OsmY
VRQVINEMAISAPTGFTSRSSDSYVTAKVKTRFLDDDRFSANHVKVVTERGNVYLMGLVKREEGAAAAEIAAQTSGVGKVIKVFEYLD